MTGFIDMLLFIGKAMVLIVAFWFGLEFLPRIGRLIQQKLDDKINRKKERE